MDIIVICTVTNASGTINMFLGDAYSLSKNSLVFCLFLELSASWWPKSQTLGMNIWMPSCLG